VLDDINSRVLLASLAMNVLLVLASGLTWRPAASRRWRRVAAWPPLLLAASLVVYVASEDSYAQQGVSRWATYGAEGITCVAVAGAVAAAAVGWASRSRERLESAAVGACTLSVFLVYFALMQMSN
jgi:hypothetical protein